MLKDEKPVVWIDGVAVDVISWSIEVRKSPAEKFAEAGERFHYRLQCQAFLHGLGSFRHVNAKG